ncbi:MAG: type I asparaginase [Flavobacteriales bacterium]|nr:type I asparaginase [Flavobacteriales bacterium]
MKNSSVLIIYTGGTIGMVSDPLSGILKPFNFKNLSKEIPELKKFKIKLDSFSFAKPIDSSNMNPSIWSDLVKIVEKNYDKYDGFVILHGSDTMAYTASALSFMLENLNKPVILTGSQLPIGTIRTDGKENIITAIEIAAAKQNGKPVVPEVAIYFEYALYRGNRTKKVNAEHFQAFASPNYPKLAEAGVHLKFNHEYIRKPNNKKLNVHYQTNSNIAVLKMFPGITENYVRSVLNAHHTKAIILETFGSGNAPTEKWLLNLFKKAIHEGKIIVNVTQCIAGSVEQGKYQTSTELKKLGIIGGNDITFEAAITKLMHLLVFQLSYTQLKKKFVTSISGEITKS